MIKDKWYDVTRKRIQGKDSWKPLPLPPLKRTKAILTFYLSMFKQYVKSLFQ